MNEVAKHLVINCKTQRERDQYIIDNANYFRCVYKTNRSNIPSEKVNDLDTARIMATFSVKLMRRYPRRDSAVINVVAYLEDSKGKIYDAIADQIKPVQSPSAGDDNGEEKRAPEGS